MNLKLVRNAFESSGIYGVLLNDETNEQVAVTLEHAYPCNSDTAAYFPKVPSGVYTCVRGMHQLEGMTSPFQTFEVTGVSGHQGILFHVGNFDDDSEGCILLGEIRSGDSISQSRSAFQKFMGLQSGLDEFTLTVV